MNFFHFVQFGLFPHSYSIFNLYYLKCDKIVSSLPHEYIDADHAYFDGQVVGQNQQTLEVGEEKSLEREDVLLKQIKELMNKLKLADTRSENSEMDISRLNIRIDKVEEDLITEKAKIKQVSDDLNAVFEDLM